MVNVADCAYVYVRLGPLELTFCHFTFPSKRTMSINNQTPCPTGDRVNLHITSL
jgi:hypothetical protein